MDINSVKEILDRAVKRELAAIRADKSGDLAEAATNRKTANLYFRRAMVILAR